MQLAHLISHVFPSMPRRWRLKVEERFQHRCVVALAHAVLDGSLNAKFAHFANEVAVSGISPDARQKMLAKRRALGARPGLPDLLIWSNVRTLEIELKVGRNPLTEAQKTERDWSREIGIPHRVVWIANETEINAGVERVLDHCRDVGLLSGNKQEVA